MIEAITAAGAFVMGRNILGRGERLLDNVGDITLEPLCDPSGTGLVSHLTYRVIR
ncbi:hypothetical protein [Nonomuraea cypriaca]|uniref:hypothetical protein n=1 Tax=Nonomuraea cypriaca TaxID=1187855 RepID=UPI001A9C915A|nr:hypothetical protein [Nonomuraea cypriaca]